MPGSATPSEAMRLMDDGYTIQKFFPAEQSGGVRYLKALASVLPAVSFCPTGGVDGKNAGDYLALGNVVCVGGSWITPKDALGGGDFARIEALAREASKLGVKW
jgi:2-dehydro-3-deoxyphosphogluconate aldolase/(4S)-4-hydroxy-2-oxoglutarate aldolase